MPDISTQNLDGDQDSPRLARVELLETVGRVNALTARIKTDVDEQVKVNTSLVVDGPALLSSYFQVAGQVTMQGAASVGGDLVLHGGLKIDNAPPAGYALVSQGPGEPLAWSLIQSGDRYRSSSTSTLDLDGPDSLDLVVQGGLSLTANQTVVIAHDAENYFLAKVAAYNQGDGSLLCTRIDSVGSGEYNTWTVNIAGGGAKGDPGTGTPGTDGATWFTDAGVPTNGLGRDNDYYLNKTNGDYYQRSGGAWSLVGNLKGVAGAAGARWYSNAGVPAAGLGANNDFCVDSTTGDYYSKSAGAWSLQGSLKGTAGTAGSQWSTGTGAPNNANGANTDMYLNKTNGDFYQKSAGAWALQGNLMGPAGSGGGGGSSTVFSTTARYQAITTTGLGVTIVSSASVKTGISWTRTGTSMTFTDNGHGRSVNERAILRNTSTTAFDSLITAVTTNTFTVTCADSGATSGTAGAYSMGFTYAYNAASGSITAGTVSAPVGWDCVLLSIRIHLAPNTRSATTFNLTVPKGNVNGAGPHNNMDDVSVPVQMVRQDGNTLTAVGNTISTNTAVAGDYATYQFAAIPAVTTGIHILAQF